MLIKPSTAIRQDYTGFARLCHETEEPVVLTRNGEADLVVMSYEAFQRREARARLEARLVSADRQLAAGEGLVDSADLFARVQERVDAVPAE